MTVLLEFSKGGGAVVALDPFEVSEIAPLSGDWALLRMRSRVEHAVEEPYRSAVDRVNAARVRDEALIDDAVNVLKAVERECQAVDDVGFVQLAVAANAVVRRLERQRSGR